LVDTVFGGCYKKEIFEKIGLFNKNLVGSQDMEFNLRLQKAGGKILLVQIWIQTYKIQLTLKSFYDNFFPWQGNKGLSMKEHFIISLQGVI
jgi:GT2 family glycosyltransferase